MEAIVGANCRTATGGCAVLGWKRKRHLDPAVEVPRKLAKTDYLAPKIASLAALATRNFTTFLAAIWMISPVAGLRPWRALRLTSTSFPKPGSVKLFLAFL